MEHGLGSLRGRREAFEVAEPDAGVLGRARGAFLGQLAGDAVGSVVEFQDPLDIAARYPGGVDMVASPCWGTIPGRPTDHSELALDLGWTLVEHGAEDFPDDRVANAYADWLASDPFDRGRTITRALSAIARGAPGPARAARAAADPTSEANGALMRESPLAIWGWRLDRAKLAQLARRDCSLAHPSPVCQAASAVYVVAMAAAVRESLPAADVYRLALATAEEIQAPKSVHEALARAEDAPPVCHGYQMGHVIRALQNAFYELLHAASPGQGIVATVMRGGDTDTNAAIAGALLGAVHGESDVPERWQRTLASCRPDRSTPGVRRPRPERYWPALALHLPDRLVAMAPAEIARESAEPFEW